MDILSFRCILCHAHRVVLGEHLGLIPGRSPNVFHGFYPLVRLLLDIGSLSVWDSYSFFEVSFVIMELLKLHVFFEVLLYLWLIQLSGEILAFILIEDSINIGVSIFQSWSCSPWRFSGPKRRRNSQTLPWHSYLIRRVLIRWRKIISTTILCVGELCRNHLNNFSRQLLKIIIWWIRTHSKRHVIICGS